MKKSLGLFVYVLYLLILLEVSSRAYWGLAHDVPLLRMGDIFQVYYPEVETARQSHCGDEGVDVLLLGASVLNSRVSPEIEPLLSAKLGALYDQDVCVHNLSRLGHTTLDSYYKFKKLADLSFDLVIAYHGINETRANNCPSAIFRDDYGHYSWYEKINALMEHAEINYLVFPWTLHYAYLEFKSLHYAHQYVPRHVPENELWLRMGAGIKTKKTFRRNMTSILRLAGQNGSTVVLNTFAYHLPGGYTKERFDGRQLGYAEGSAAMPVEIWGLPENVVSGINVHNRMIREIAADAEDALYVDQDNGIPKSGRYFVDICHLSPEGQRLFVENIMGAIEAVTLTP
jgi:hypothetical protein